MVVRWVVAALRTTPIPYLSTTSMSMVLGRLFLFADVLHITSGLGCLFSATTAGGLGRLFSTTKVWSTFLFGGHLCSITINPPPAFFDSSSARVVVGVDGCYVWTVVAHLVSMQVCLLHDSVLQGLACFGCCHLKKKILLGPVIDFGLCG